MSKIAKSEPQEAYSCFTAGFRHKVTYFIRTIPDLVDIMAPLDEIIDNQFIPAITEGHQCSIRDRKLLWKETQPRAKCHNSPCGSVQHYQFKTTQTTHATV